MLVPEQYGGGSVTGEGILDLVEIAEEAGRFIHAAPVLSTNAAAYAIAQYGSPELRQEFLPAIAAGETPAAWCFAEDSGSFDADDLSLRIRRVSGGFELQGSKRFVQDGHCAGVLLVTGRDDDGGLTQVVVRNDAPGVVVEPLTSMDFSRRVAAVRFEGTTVPVEAVVGMPGAAGPAVAQQLMLALVLQCADSVGAMGALNDMTFEYAKERFAYGRPIGSFQAIKHKCVEMFMGFIGSQAVTAAAAKAFQTGDPDAGVRASIAKAYVGDAFSRNGEHAHQVHGGIGYTWEHDTHLYSRHAKFHEAMFGSPHWHRDRLSRGLGI